MLLLAVPEWLMATTPQRRTTQRPSAQPSKPPSAQPASSKSGPKRRGRRSRHSRNWRRRGQQKVDARRTQQIQEALIRSHYLEGEPTGAWDVKTQEALRRYQVANGWQSKVVPDSRALIKLGLGPSNDRLLNPESAMTSHAETTPSGANAHDTNIPQQ